MLTRDESSATAPRISTDAAARACSTLLGVEPVRIEYPGGASRCSVRAVAEKSSYIVTRRNSAPRAALEAGVLRELRAAAQLGLPDPDIGALITPQQMAPRRYSFVKWDARPGNALLVEGGADEGGVGWVDWEHCGARDALDDLAWLLCDEYMPDDPELEAALLQRFLPLFALQSQRAVSAGRGAGRAVSACPNFFSMPASACAPASVEVDSAASPASPVLI